jgi:hypothetical protein
MGVILTHGSGSSSSSGSGAFSQIEKLALEMELEYKTANASYFKDLNYSAGGLLTNIDIWTDSGMTLQLFGKLLQYDSSENLSRTVLTRITDSAQIAKILVYDGSGNLNSLNVSAG